MSEQMPQNIELGHTVPCLTAQRHHFEVLVVTRDHRADVPVFDTNLGHFIFRRKKRAPRIDRVITTKQSEFSLRRLSCFDRCLQKCKGGIQRLANRYIIVGRQHCFM